MSTTNGKSLYMAQIKCGVRTIVEDLDSLRIKYSNESVQVLTPKVETRLRSGDLPAIPLRVQVTLPSRQIVVIIYEVGYPETVPLKLEYEFEMCSDMTNKVDEYRNTKTHETGYYRLTLDVLNFLSDLISVSDQDNNTIDSQSGDNVSDSNLPCDQSDSVKSDECTDRKVDDFEQNEVTTKISDETEYKCVVCRTFLYHHKDLQHSAHSSSFNSTKCTSYFLHSLPDWHQSHVGELSGKIVCPNIKCVAKLGYIIRI